ncbi:MAG: hypothetical protein HGA84_04575 [Syntrophobacteraceae bacterium]|nr:hypothetical protein [Syntrophobacteraceae bacterium]
MNCTGLPRIWSFTVIFNLSLPSGVDQIDITEEEDAITVTTCFGATVPCERHTFTL